MSARLHVGTSGWRYRHWRGVLYPRGMPPRQWFARYADAFASVEVNNTFSDLPDAGAFDAWRDQAPDGFVYALKCSRYGTHLRKLRDPAAPLDAFLARARRLRDGYAYFNNDRGGHAVANARDLRRYVAGEGGDA